MNANVFSRADILKMRKDYCINDVDIDLQDVDKSSSVEAPPRPPAAASDAERSKASPAERCGAMGRNRWMNLALFSILIGLLALQVAFALSQYIFDDSDKEVMASATLVASIIIGIIAVCVLFQQFLEGKVETKGHEFDLHARPFNALLRNSLSLVGLVLFCPFACLLEMFQIFMAISCEIWRSDQEDEGESAYYKVDGSFHFLHIVFMALELLLCVQFRKITFMRNVSACRRFVVKLALVVIVSVNVGTWFNIILYETSKNSQKNSDPQPSNNNNSGTEEDDSMAEYCSKDLFGGMDETVRHILYPFTVEFSLQVLEYVTCHFILAEETSQQETVPKNPKRLNRSKSSETSIARETISNSPAAVAEERNHLKRRWAFDTLLVIIFGLLPNLICITLVTFANDTLMSGSFAKKAEVFSLQYMSCHWIMMICLVVVGIACVRRGRFGVRVELNGFDYLVMISVFGPFLARVLRVIVIADRFEELRESIDPVVALMPEVLNLVQLLLQLPFVFYADSVDCTGEARKRPSWRLFKAAVVSLAMWNITLWLIDSVLLRVDVLENFFEETTWLYLDGVFRPLTIFYRFNSCLILLRAYLR